MTSLIIRILAQRLYLRSVGCIFVGIFSLSVVHVVASINVSAIFRADQKMNMLSE